jgi:hypothetical protein
MIKVLFFLGITLFANPAYAACTGPVGVPGDLMYNTTYDVFQGCTKRGWYRFHESAAVDPCAGSPSPGTTCADGSIYVGTTVGGEALYAADVDQSSAIAWASVSEINLSSRSFSDGKANQADIVANRTLSQYPAFELCENLSRHDHSDWYLPARDEMGNLNAVAGMAAGTLEVSDLLCMTDAVHA